MVDFNRIAIPIKTRDEWLDILRKADACIAPEGLTPEFMLIAVGDVRFAHSVRGIGSLAEGLTMLHLHNDRRIEK